MDAEKTVTAWRCDDGACHEREEALTVELPLQITINGEPYSVTMRTPGHDGFLVSGLLLTESVAIGGYDTFTVEAVASAAGGVATVDVRIPEIYLCPNVLARRSLIVSAACGLCGQRELDAADLENTPLAPAGTFRLSRVPALMAAMQSAQTTFSRTGSAHAAAVYTLAGQLLHCFEDIGRHNAVDKAIGALLQERQLGAAQVLAVSGRVSFEIVLKAYRAGLPFILAVSAPSSFAVELAECWGLTVIGFCRDTRATVYSNPGQVSDCDGDSVGG
jgi:FdhD protein